MIQRVSPDRLLISDPSETIGRIRGFLKHHKVKTNASAFIVGMSGGLDSSVTAALCALAIGGKNVLGVHLPENETRSENSIQDARLVAKKYGIRFATIDITDLVRAASSILPNMNGKSRPIPAGNVKARLRAVVLYYLANRNKGLVVGTGDKSEIMLGYFTKFGDGACDLQPIADLYKTSVRDLARRLHLPERIASKPSSPELWAGQTAMEELRVEYEKLDMILWGLERWMSPEDISQETGLPLRLVKNVRTRWIDSEHKRRPPITMKMGYRTAGSDLRLPYSIG